MLLLQRKVGQRINVGNDIIVVVQRIRGQRVSIGIEAPLAVVVERAEFKERREGERKDGAE